MTAYIASLFRHSYLLIICELIVVYSVLICSTGTRIVYDRNALLLMRNSPLSKTPPVGIPAI